MQGTLPGTMVLGKLAKQGERGGSRATGLERPLGTTLPLP